MALPIENTGGDLRIAGPNGPIHFASTSGHTATELQQALEAAAVRASCEGTVLHEEYTRLMAHDGPEVD